MLLTVTPLILYYHKQFHSTQVVPLNAQNREGAVNSGSTIYNVYLDVGVWEGSGSKSAAHGIWQGEQCWTHRKRMHKKGKKVKSLFFIQNGHTMH